MGERDGSPDALSVELVDVTEFKSKTTVPLQADRAGANPATPAPPPQPAEAPASAAPSHEEKKTTEWAIDKEALEKVPPPTSASKQSEPAPKAKDEPHPKRKPAVSSLQLDLPPELIAPPGRSTAATRPPDITRSGENDEFGRGVIRALRQTMPGPRGQIGRVTVRLLLSNTGNLVEVELIRGAADPTLTQSVVFAVKQSSFPIPPAGATLSDRTFLVTYIYN